MKEYTEEEKRQILIFAEEVSKLTWKYDFPGKSIEEMREKLIERYDHLLSVQTERLTRISQDRKFLLDIAVRAQEPLKDALKIATKFMETGKVEE